MTCKEVIERLSEYWSNELDERTRDEVTEHLRGCPSCRHEWTDFQAAMSALQSVPTPEPFPELLSRIQSAVMAKHHRKPVFVWSWRWAMAFSAAAIAVALVSVPIFRPTMEKARVSIPQPILAEKAAPSLPSPTLRQPSPPPITMPPSLKSLPSPTEQIVKPRRSTITERHEARATERRQGYSESGKLLLSSPTAKLPVLSVPSGERLPEQSMKDIPADISLPAEQTNPKLAELPVEPRILPFRTEAKLSESVKVPGAGISGQAHTPQNPIGSPTSQGPIGPHGPAAAVPTIGAFKSRGPETQILTETGQHYPAIRQQYGGGLGQLGGGLGQALHAIPFGLRWARFEPVVVGRVRLWELALSYENQQVVTVFIRPGEKVEVLNAQQPVTWEGKGLVIWRDKLPLSKEVSVPILLRANEVGTRKLLLTVEAIDGKTFSWWCIFPAMIREERPKISRLITLHVEQWTVLDLFAHLAWETKVAFLLPEQIGYMKVNMPIKAMPLAEILNLTEQQLGGRWLRFGGTFFLSTQIPAPVMITPTMKQLK